LTYQANSLLGDSSSLPKPCREAPNISKRLACVCKKVYTHSHSTYHALLRRLSVQVYLAVHHWCSVQLVDTLLLLENVLYVFCMYNCSSCSLHRKTRSVSTQASTSAGLDSSFYCQLFVHHSGLSGRGKCILMSCRCLCSGSEFIIGRHSVCQHQRPASRPGAGNKHHLHSLHNCCHVWICH